MRIILDQNLDAQGRVQDTQFIDTDTMLQDKFPDPAGGPGTVDIHALLTHLNNNPQDHGKHGFDVVNQLPGETQPKSRWRRLVDNIGHPLAPASLKALNLK